MCSTFTPPVLPKVIHIDLAESVVKAKLLGRRECTVCKRSFNLADVMTEGYNMPAILPNPENCPLGINNCKPVLISRKDDVPDIINKRIEVYNDETRPILEFFADRNLLTNFVVKKGISDTDDLIHTMIDTTVDG